MRMENIKMVSANLFDVNFEQNLKIIKLTITNENAFLLERFLFLYLRNYLFLIFIICNKLSNF